MFTSKTQIIKENAVFIHRAKEVYYLYNVEEVNSISIDSALERLTGTGIVAFFGEPFIGAFAKAYPESSDEERKVAAYTCALFLSAILKGFPTDRLHTFVRYTRDYCRHFTFNCKMYDTIFDLMNKEIMTKLPLYDSNCNGVEQACSKNDIFEAFDFYTNK